MRRDGGRGIAGQDAVQDECVTPAAPHHSSISAQLSLRDGLRFRARDRTSRHPAEGRAAGAARGREPRAAAEGREAREGLQGHEEEIQPDPHGTGADDARNQGQHRGGAPAENDFPAAPTFRPLFGLNFRRVLSAQFRWIAAQSKVDRPKSAAKMLPEIKGPNNEVRMLD